MLGLIVLSAALLPQGPPTSCPRASYPSSLPFVTTAPVAGPLAAALATIPLAVFAEAAFFENAATPGDIGVRPTVGGVSIFAFYIVYQVCFQVLLRMRNPGGANVALINGTKFIDGKRADSPFNRGVGDTIRAAAEASKRLRNQGGEDGKQDDRKDGQRSGGKK